MICKVLNYSYKVVGRFGEETNSSVRKVMYFLIFFMALLYGSSILAGVHLLVKCAIGAVLLGVIILFSVNGPVQPQKWNKPMTVMWFGIGILQLISGIFVSIEYLPMACIWLVGFPTLFLVWSNRKDYVVLFTEVAAAGNACFLLMIVLSVLLYPLGSNAYGGVLRNPNGMGQWITFVYPLIIFLYYNEKKKSKKQLYSGEIALVFLFAVLSRGRTALLALIVMTLIAVAARLMTGPNGLRYLCTRSVCFVLVVCVSCGSFLTVNHVSAFVTEKVGLPHIQIGGYDIVAGETLPDEWEIPKDDPFFDEEDLMNPDVSHTGNERYVKKMIERVLGLDKAGKSLEDYSSGRVGIWLKSLESANLFGHPSREHIVTNRKGDVGSNVHNTVFQFMYDNGVIVGLLFMVMMVYAWIRTLAAALRKRSVNGIEIAFLMIQTGYIITGAFTSLNVVFLYLIGFFYYLTFSVLFDKDCAKAELPGQNP